MTLQKLGVVPWTCIPSPGEAEMGASWDLMDFQSRLTGEPQASEKPCLKTQGMGRGTDKVSQQVRVLGNKPDSLNLIPPEHTWYKEKANSSTHVPQYACTHTK